MNPGREEAPGWWSRWEENVGKAGLTILVVDDDPAHRAMLGAFLEGRDLEVLDAETAEAALEILGRTRPDLVLLDMRMPGIGGMGFLEEALGRDPALHVVVVTAFAEVETAVEAMKLGARDFLTKPLDLSLLDEILCKYTEIGEDAAYGEDHPLLPEGMVFHSPLMKQVLSEVSAAASSDAPVLFSGDSGCGKEVLAELLHRWSPRSSGPLVRINLAAVPESLLEAEFFGHERGAFTGAARARKGYFEEARGGTLFLDEVGDLPPSLQPKLLRALDTGKIRRLGGGEEIELDARIVTATNKDLEEEVEAGRFRLDLYYRLAVFVVEIPPLRERTEDILPLAARFLAGAGGRGKRLSRAAESCLLAYSWPGNVRELRNSVERASILAAGEWILPEHLPPAVRGGGCRPSRGRESQGRSLAEIERDAIMDALERCGGNRTRAAKELGISRRKLLYRLKEYGENDKD